MPMIIDSHFHYPSTLKKDCNSTLPENLIGLEIGLNGGDLRSRIPLIGDNKNIFLSVGAGPWVLDRDDFISVGAEIELLEKDIIEFGADAVGELGFDNHWNYGTKESQRELFEMQIDLARKYNLAVAIHTRDADKELLDSLSYIDDRTIMHCYSSDKTVAKILLDRGAYFSFAGNVTYKRNTVLQESAKYIPLDRLLYETDAPYLSPIPMRGKVNNPAYTEYTAEFLAVLKGVDKELLKEHVLENFYKVLGRTESIVKREI